MSHNKSVTYQYLLNELTVWCHGTFLVFIKTNLNLRVYTRLLFENSPANSKQISNSDWETIKNKL